jgi:menaquinone-dependent protoporphyrinogen oxidase
MRTVIFYASKYGTTASVANEIAESITLDEEVEVLDIKKFNWDFIPDFKAVSRFVIGVPMYAGKPLKSMRKFCDTFSFKLETKPLFLFACGSEISPEKQQAELDAAFPERLRKAAFEAAFLGGAFHWKKMNFMERFIIKRITGRTGDMDMIRHKAIKKFAEQISSGF